MYKTILIGIDNSSSSDVALLEASSWVKKHGGKIILVHAVYFDTEEFGNAPEQMEKRLKAGEEVCIQAKDMITSEFGIEVQSLVCEGDISSVIIDIAEEKKADIIVLGTYGRKGLSRLLMGSVTAHVIANSHTDVLVVKKQSKEYTGIYRSILIPFDASESSKKALNRACQLAKIDNSETTVLYVIPCYEEMIEFLRTDSVKKSLMSEAQRILDEAKNISAIKNVSVTTEIAEGHASEEIIKTVDRLKNDLIVMGSYGWRGFDKAIIGSTVERTILKASCPVLVVR